MDIAEQDRTAQSPGQEAVEDGAGPRLHEAAARKEHVQLKANFDATIFRRVLGHYPTGVCVITAIDPAGVPVGMAVGSFTSVSLDPPLVGFMPDKSSTSWPRIAAAGHFCVNVLSTDQQDLCRRFSAKAANKFEDLHYDLSQSGCPVLKGVVAWIDCRISAVYEAGDHFIVLGEVLDLSAQAGQPLLFVHGQYGSFRHLLSTS